MSSKNLLSLTITISFLFTLVFFVSFASAETYWIDDAVGGKSSLNDCKGATPLNGINACYFASVDYGSSIVIGDDTVYFREGTYQFEGENKDGISPDNSGSSGHMITFSAYNDEDVEFVGESSGWYYAVDLKAGQDYIKIHGIDFTNWFEHLQMWDASHCEISHCTFIGMADEENPAWVASELQSTDGGSGSNYNWIHHCTFAKNGWLTADNHFGAVMDIGWDNGIDPSSHNLIENCEFYSGGHHVLGINGNHNVLRNNYLHNEGWDDVGGTLYGHRIAHNIGYSDTQRNLIESNRFAYASGCADDIEPSGDGIMISSQYHILRRNLFIQNALNGIFMQKYADPHLAADYNKIYNNVFWHNGHDRSQTWKTYWQEIYSHGGCIVDNENCEDNVFKNNIWYQNYNSVDPDIDLIDFQRDVPSEQIIVNEWNGNVHGDPKFVDISGTPDPMDGTQFDFHLQSDSGCIDNGGFLTTIISPSGSGTSFVVDDAGYFFDGWGIAAEIPAASISGDIIQLEGQTQTATITNVDYGTNTITVDTSLTWTQGQGVSLAYEGSAPDQGAYEYIEEPPACDAPSGNCFYVDNAATGCSSGDTDYDLSTRSCGSGSETVYTSIQEAINVATTPGDVISVRAGTYPESITMQASGMTDNYIKLRAYAEEDVTISPGIGNVAINLDAHDWIWIDGFAITGGCAGIRYRPSGTADVSEHIKISNNIITDQSGSSDLCGGIIARPYYWEIYGNTLSGQSGTPVREMLFWESRKAGIDRICELNIHDNDFQTHSAQDHIYVGGCINVVIRDNVFSGSGGGTGHDDSIQTECTNNCLIDHNIFFDTENFDMDYQTCASGYHLDNTVITNNVFIGIAGITVNHKEGKCTVYNNTFYNGDYQALRLEERTGYGNGHFVKNNVFYGNGGYNSYADPREIDYNCYHSNGNPEQNDDSGSQNIQQDPQFQSTSDFDGPDNIWWTSDDGLRPSSDSPVCGAGEGGSDIGAYECTGPLQDCTSQGGYCCGASESCPGSIYSASDCPVCCSLSCVPCGNNIREYPELCDGTDLAGETCQSLGYDGGSLDCLQDCSDFITSGCFMSSPYFKPELFVEAEDGDLNNMQTGTGSGSSGQYVYSSTNEQGSAGFTFNISQSGPYRMEARILSPPPTMGGHNSFYVGLDGEPAQGDSTMTFDTLETDAFAWDNVSLRGPNGTFDYSEYDPMVWELSQGLHTFTFYGRESNTWLDQIILKRLSHRADSDGDGCITMQELAAFITLWKQDSTAYPMTELMGAIGLWRAGAGC